MNFEALHKVIDTAVQQKIIPGGAVSVWKDNRSVDEYHMGHLEITPNNREVTEESIWDIASLTKVLGTTPIMMYLVSQGLVSLSDPIQKYLPHAPVGPTIENCLQHSSGYKNWRAYFKLSQFIKKSIWGTDAFRKQMLKRVSSDALQYESEQRHVYSDLGFMTLCAVIEEVFGGKRIDQVWEDVLPVEAKQNLMWTPKSKGQEVLPKIAATEMCPLRLRTIIGDVHDLNAYMLGGCSGHAGLFGRVVDVAAAGDFYLQLYHNDICSEISRETVQKFFTSKGVGSHALGWDTPSGERTTASQLWPKNGVGHLAFTGCSLWIAPDEKVVVAFCSNFVHPKVEGGAIPSLKPIPTRQQLSQLRREIHAAAWTGIFG